MIDDIYLFALGMLSTLAGSTAWLIFATFMALPVSTTQTIVGGIVGFAAIERGFRDINIGQLINIAISWVVSPLLGGVISFFVYFTVLRLILKADAPMKRIDILFPIYTSVTSTALLAFVITVFQYHITYFSPYLILLM